MENDNHVTQKLLLGLLIAGVAGAGALYYIQNKKTPVLKKIGRTISEVGEMIEECELDSVSDAVEHLEKKMPNVSDMIGHLAGWVNQGLTIWKKIKKG